MDVLSDEKTFLLKLYEDNNDDDYPFHLRTLVREAGRSPVSKIFNINGESGSTVCYFSLILK